MASTFRHTSNPAFSDAAMSRAAQDLQPGWGAPQGTTATAGAPPMVTDRSAAMSFGGVVSATGVLLALLAVASAFGWNMVEQTSFIDPRTGEEIVTTNWPGWLFLPILGGLGLAILTVFKPNLARVTSPLYAVVQGLAVGAISAVYDAAYNGIVLQAVLCTIGVFTVMLFLYATRIIRVTQKLAIGIVAATGGVFLAYMLSWVFSMFSDSTPAIWDSGAFGIGFSVLVVGIAAFNLLLDFDFIERGVEAGLPKGMEWYAGFGLIVTLVWLYLEILRLLAKLQQR